jgi:hypothetical protein
MTAFSEINHPLHLFFSAIPILRPGRPLPRAAQLRARYGPAWSAHFAFSLSVVVSFSFSFLFSAIFMIFVLT